MKKYILLLILLISSCSFADTKRGFMVSTSTNPESMFGKIDEIAGFGGNIIRWQIVGLPDGGMNTESYLDFIDAHIDSIQGVSSYIKEKGYKIKILVDQHHLPGGEREVDDSVYDSESVIGFRGKYRAAFYEGWKRIATALKGDRTIFGYDLANEPKITKDRLLKLYKRTYRKIRRIDRRTYIILEPTVGSPRWIGQLAGMAKSKRKRIIYSPHNYHPMSLTHGNLDPNTQAPLYYPTAGFNFNDLDRFLSKVKKFKDNHNARILIGEFGFTSYSEPGNQKRWIRDNIEIFEREGYDWIYHAVFECACWHPRPETLRMLKKKLKLNK